MTGVVPAANKWGAIATVVLTVCSAMPLDVQQPLRHLLPPDWAAHYAGLAGPATVQPAGRACYSVSFGIERGLRAHDGVRDLFPAEEAAHLASLRGPAPLLPLQLVGNGAVPARVNQGIGTSLFEYLVHGVPGLLNQHSANAPVTLHLSGTLRGGGKRQRSANRRSPTGGGTGQAAGQESDMLSKSTRTSGAGVPSNNQRGPKNNTRKLAHATLDQGVSPAGTERQFGVSASRISQLKDMRPVSGTLAADEAASVARAVAAERGDTPFQQAIAAGEAADAVQAGLAKTQAASTGNHHRSARMHGGQAAHEPGGGPRISARLVMFPAIRY